MAAQWSAAFACNELVALTKLPAEMQKAAAAAVEACARSYCPYSNFSVGAALLHKDNSITMGCNYENCTLQSCCAERCALVKANVEGRRTAKAVAVFGKSTRSDPAPESVCPPCGLCRQLLVELADLSGNYDSFEVILVSGDKGRANVIRLAELIPHKFGPSDIGMDVSKLAQ